MKKNILFVLALTAFGANAQQKLIGLTTTEFDETGAMVYNDSINYSYSTWEGSLTSNEPQFKFDRPVFDWLYELPTILSTTQDFYSGTPLTLDFTQQNTILNGQLSESEITQNEKQVYTYDASGNLTKLEYFFWNVSQFDIAYETNYEYDANNNLTVTTVVTDPAVNPTTESVDSLFYDASNNLVRSISYQSNGSILEPVSESLITYSGNEISNLQIFEATTPSQLDWTFDVDYTYSGGIPTLIEGYPVTGGVPATTPEIEITYAYNAANQLTLYQGYLGGDLFVEQSYAYDAVGFVETIESSELDFATSTLYLAEVKDFYYQSTADVNELISAEAKVYPNPTDDFITIDSDAHVERITVFTRDGKIMIDQKGNTVDVSNLTAGTYLVKVMTTEGIAQTSFVKN